MSININLPYAIFIGLFLTYSCSESKTQNKSLKSNNKNDALYESLSKKLKKSNFHCDSLMVVYQDELNGKHGAFGLGPVAYRLEKQLDSCLFANQKMKIQLDSLFLLTSKEFKTAYYQHKIKDLDNARTEKEHELAKYKEMLNSEMQGNGMNRGGYGPEAKKIESQFSAVIEELRIIKVTKDSINTLLGKLK